MTSLTKANLDVIFKSQEQLAVQYEVDKHLQSGLLETLKAEKKWRQHGKKLNLLSETDTWFQLFHSFRVCTALAYKAEKNEKATIEKADKETKKAQGQENICKKKEEAEKRALQRQVAKDLKAQVAAEKQAAKESKRIQQKLPKNIQKQSYIAKLPLKTISNSSAKAVTFAEDVEVVGEAEGSKIGRTKTREIKLPERFKK